MAPHAEEGPTSAPVPVIADTTAYGGHVKKQNNTTGNGTDIANHIQTSKPLQLSGSLEEFDYFDVTPVIGREYKDVDLATWLQSSNSEELLRDLAITISQRGVVFFRSQTTLTDPLQKQLIQRLGALAGKPATSTLHIHPVSNSSRSDATTDDEISVISSRSAKSIYKDSAIDPRTRKQSGKGQWHSDITFEPVPSDYTALRLTELPKTGGNTLWASGYELYDRISPPYQQFLSTLTATYAQPAFNAAASSHSFPLYTAPRGSPHNVGETLQATHPVIRTNPVTGWRSVFAVGHHVQKVNEVAAEESAALLEWFTRLVVENHDLQVRFRWGGEGDLAIWDNRSVYHAATPDYDGLGERKGHRVVGVGERPFFDPESRSRREALAAGEKQDGVVGVMVS